MKKYLTFVLAAMLLCSVFAINMASAESKIQLDELNLEGYATEELESLQARIAEELKKRTVSDEATESVIQDLYPGVYISDDGFEIGDYIFVCESVMGGEKGEIIIYNNDFDYRYDTENYLFRVEVAAGESVHISAHRMYVIDVRGIQGKIISGDTGSKLYPGVYISDKTLFSPGEYVFHCESITGSEPGKITIYNNDYDYRYQKNKPIFEHSISAGESIAISAKRMYVIEVVGANGSIEAK